MVVASQDLAARHPHRAEGARKIGEAVVTGLNDAGEREQLQREPAPARLPSGPPKVLVADNDQEILRLLQLILTRNGYEVVLAANGWEAFEAYSSAGGQIGVVLLDQNMPVWTGAETAEHLGKMDPAVRIILTSGGVEPDLPPHLHGFVRAFLPKPYNAEQLLRIVWEAQQ